MRKNEELPHVFKIQGEKEVPDGIYLLPHPTQDSYFYHIIFSTGNGWEHLSVTIRKLISKTARKFKQVERCPTWQEMCFCKNLFWDVTECAVQFHPAMADYISNHEYCLHIWKPDAAFPTPDSVMVGLKDGTLMKLLSIIETKFPEMETARRMEILYALDYSKINVRDEAEVNEFIESVTEQI